MTVPPDGLQRLMERLLVPAVLTGVIKQAGTFSGFDYDCHFRQQNILFPDTKYPVSGTRVNRPLVCLSTAQSGLWESATTAEGRSKDFAT